MANKRMFSLLVIDTDNFLEMPLSTQSLYFHLNMRADDDGFVNNPKKIMRMIGANQNDFDILIAKTYLIPFDSGVCVIKHWRINNYIRSDRYKPTVYQSEKDSIKDDIYLIGIPSDSHLSSSDIDLDLVLDLDKDIDRELSIKNKDILHEPLKNDSVPFVYIPLNDKTEQPIYEEEIKEWQDAYQSIDVHSELKKIRSWSLSNPKKKKSKSGVHRFINYWLAREHDKGKPFKPFIQEQANIVVEENKKVDNDQELDIEYLMKKFG